MLHQFRLPLKSRSPFSPRRAKDFRTNLIMDDLPTPQAPETPIEIGRPSAWTTISATVSATHR